MRKTKPRKRAHRKNHHVKRGSKKREIFTKKDIFVSRMASILQVSPSKAKSFFSQRIVSAIRLNNLAGNTHQIRKILEEKGCDLKHVPWSKNTFIVTNMDKSELAKLNAYKNGLFYIQSLSSMIPVLILDPQPGEKILDMTAAPGSKTSMIAAMSDNKALITANDNNYDRAKKMGGLMKLFHVENVQISVSDGVKYGDEMKNQFDKVLLDAPCSGEGQIYLQGDNPLRFWSIRKAKHLVRTQEDLIIAAFEALKPGGTLVYSTCTLEPMENEGVVTTLLNRFPSAKLENIDLDGIKEFEDYKRYTTRGIRKWSGSEYDKFMGKTLRILPGEVMQGFYVAHITKEE